MRPGGDPSKKQAEAMRRYEALYQWLYSPAPTVLNWDEFMAHCPPSEVLPKVNLPAFGDWGRLQAHLMAPRLVIYWIETYRPELLEEQIKALPQVSTGDVVDDFRELLGKLEHFLEGDWRAMPHPDDRDWKSLSYSSRSWNRPVDENWLALLGRSIGYVVVKLTDMMGLSDLFEPGPFLSVRGETIQYANDAWKVASETPEADLRPRLRELVACRFPFTIGEGIEEPFDLEALGDALRLYWAMEEGKREIHSHLADLYESNLLNLRGATDNEDVYYVLWPEAEKYMKGLVEKYNLGGRTEKDIAAREAIEYALSDIVGEIADEISEDLEESLE